MCCDFGCIYLMEVRLVELEMPLTYLQLQSFQEMRAGGLLPVTRGAAQSPWLAAIYSKARSARSQPTSGENVITIFHYRTSPAVAVQLKTAFVQKASF